MTKEEKEVVERVKRELCAMLNRECTHRDMVPVSGYVRRECNGVRIHCYKGAMFRGEVSGYFYINLGHGAPAEHYLAITTKGNQEGSVWKLGRVNGKEVGLEIRFAMVTYDECNRASVMFDDMDWWVCENGSWVRTNLFKDIFRE